MARFFHRPMGMHLAVWGGWALVRGIGTTNSLPIVGIENVDALVAKHQPVILALWHGRHFLLVDRFRRKYSEFSRLCVLTSTSGDGEILSRILERFHYLAVRGSSNRGGARGLLRLVACLRDGYSTVVAVDGPRGPRYQVKPGIVLLARTSGVPIIPVSSSAHHAWVLRSWDRYLIPFPFSSAVATIGEPVFVPSDANEDVMEACRNRLETELHRITQQADTLCGRTEINPHGGMK